PGPVPAARTEAGVEPNPDRGGDRAGRDGPAARARIARPDEQRDHRPRGPGDRRKPAPRRPQRAADHPQPDPEDHLGAARRPLRPGADVTEVSPVPVSCPCCKASNDVGPNCRRCKADLSLLFAVEARRTTAIAETRQLAANSRFPEALAALG